LTTVCLSLYDVKKIPQERSFWGTPLPRSNAKDLFSRLSRLQKESVFPVFYSDVLQPTVMLDIQEESLGKPFIISAVFSKGDSRAAIAHMSASGDDSNVFAFKLSDGKGFTLDVYRPQYYVRIDDDSELKDAYDLGVYEGFESSFQYFKSAQTGGYIIDITHWVANMFGLFGELVLKSLRYACLGLRVL